MDALSAAIVLLLMLLGFTTSPVPVPPPSPPVQLVITAPELKPKTETLFKGTPPPAPDEVP